MIGVVQTEWIVGAIVVVALVGVVQLSSRIDVAIFELRRANKYLQRLCWRVDQEQGVDPKDWEDPAA